MVLLTPLQLFAHFKTVSDSIAAQFFGTWPFKIHAFDVDFVFASSSMWCRLITSFESRRESLLVEGVHLSLNFVVRLMQVNLDAAASCSCDVTCFVLFIVL